MGRKVKIKAIPDDENLDAEPTLELMADGMAKYGAYVLEDRAIPDFRDGLKPVQRRILWAMNGLGLVYSRGFRKSSQTVGETMAKYHPHGDSACYGALVSMTHAAEPFVDGQGNFGDLLYPPAAARYTEARLTKFSCENFFDSAFVPVIEHVSTYDGSNNEPVVLPSLLPNLLLNGVFGIGVAATCSIPAFERKGVLKLIDKALRGKEVTTDECMKWLVPISAEGAYVDLDDAANQSGLRDFYDTGRGRVKWEPSAEGDIDDRTLTISGFAPKAAGRKLQTALDKAMDDDAVQSVLDVSNIGTGRVYKIVIKQRVAKARLESVMRKICGYFAATQTLTFTATKRFPPDEEGAEAETAFDHISMPDFFRLWAKWRIRMERRSILHKKKLTEEKLERDGLLLIAAENRDVIRASWEVADQLAFLMKKLKLNEVQAKVIQELRIRQLNKLEEKALRTRIADGKKTHQSAQNAVRQSRAGHHRGDGNGRVGHCRLNEVWRTHA